MKKILVAASLALATFASYASTITEFQAVENFPTVQNDLGLVTVSGRANGKEGEGINLTYTFDTDTSYVGFKFTAQQFDQLSVQVTAADAVSKIFTKAMVDKAEMFWGFSVQGSDLQSVRFFTTNAFNDKVNNDSIGINKVIGYVQAAPATGEVPEPATVALLGLGLLGFAVARRTPTKQ